MRSRTQREIGVAMGGAALQGAQNQQIGRALEQAQCGEAGSSSP